MAKKIKLKDLDDEPELSGRSTSVTKISLDDLKDETRVIPAITSETPSTANPTAPITTKKVSSPARTPEPRPIALPSESYNLDKNIVLSVLSKAFSLAIVALVLDITLHILKFLEGVDVLVIENYKSVLMGEDFQGNALRVGGLFVVSYFIAPTSALRMNERGIFANHVSVMSFMWTSAESFVRWEEIYKVDFAVRMFEPMIFLKDINGEILAQFDFQLQNRKEFFRIVEKHAGASHPLSRLKSELNQVL